MFIPASVTQIDGNVFRDCKKALILGEPGSEAACFAKHSNISFQERDMPAMAWRSLEKACGFIARMGQQDWNYSGLSEVGDSIYYVKNGILSWSFSGLVQYEDKWYYVGDGKVDNEFEGLVKYYDDLYYVKNGTISDDFAIW